jgi:DNA-binding XRE family transcriptional regulator
MAVSGADLRRAREACGWSRTELSNRTGITVAKLASIERGRAPKPDEDTALRETLKDQLAAVLQSNVEPTPEATTTACEGNSIVRSTEWRGLQQGDRCRVEGERGQFFFKFHHADDHQEYVQVVGPPSRMKTRCIEPGRIRTSTNRKLKGEVSK